MDRADEVEAEARKQLPRNLETAQTVVEDIKLVWRPHRHRIGRQEGRSRGELRRVDREGVACIELTVAHGVVDIETAHARRGVKCGERKLAAGLFDNRRTPFLKCCETRTTRPGRLDTPGCCLSLSGCNGRCGQSTACRKASASQESPASRYSVWRRCHEHSPFVHYSLQRTAIARRSKAHSAPFGAAAADPLQLRRNCDHALSFRDVALSRPPRRGTQSTEGRT